jgi:hypothetical protein
MKSSFQGITQYGGAAFSNTKKSADPSFNAHLFSTAYGMSKQLATPESLKNGIAKIPTNLKKQMQNNTYLLSYA